MKELSKEKIIEVQSELIEHLQNYHDSTKTEIVKIVNPTWELYLEDLYSQLSDLSEGEEEHCSCGNPSGEGNCSFKGDEELIYECSDCGKVKQPHPEHIEDSVIYSKEHAEKLTK